MAELDTITITNPIGEDFECRFNGELYTLPANGNKAFPKFLAFHIVKHLSDKMLGEAKEKLRKKHAKDNPYVPQASTLFNHDNPLRRMRLYDCLCSTELVQEAILAYNYKGFVGEMKEYDEYVAQKQKKEGPTEPSETEKRGPGRPKKSEPVE